MANAPDIAAILAELERYAQPAAGDDYHTIAEYAAMWGRGEEWVRRRFETLLAAGQLRRGARPHVNLRGHHITQVVYAIGLPAS